MFLFTWKSVFWLKWFYDYFSILVISLRWYSWLWILELHHWLGWLAQKMESLLSDATHQWHKVQTCLLLAPFPSAWLAHSLYSWLSGASAETNLQILNIKLVRTVFSCLLVLSIIFKSWNYVVFQRINNLNFFKFFVIFWL